MAYDYCKPYRVQAPDKSVNKIYGYKKMMCSENNCRGNFNYLQRENCLKYAENSRKRVRRSSF